MSSMNMYRFKGLHDFSKDMDKRRRNRAVVTTTLRKIKREENHLKHRNLLDSNHDDIRKINDQNFIKELALSAADFSKPSEQIETIKSISIIFSSSDEHILAQMIEYNILSTLVKCLQHPDILLQENAVSALSSIVSNRAERTQQVIDAGAAPHLIHLLSSPNEKICDYAVWALGNIIAGGPEQRDHILNLGLVKPLLAPININTRPSYLSNVSWVITNICKWKYPSLPENVVHEILPHICKFVHHTDIAIIMDALWALNNLTNDSVETVQMVIDCDIVGQVIQLLEHSDETVQKLALITVFNIGMGTDEQTEVMLKHDLLKFLSALLSNSTDKEVHKQVIWILSNVAAGNQSHIQAIIDANILPKIIEMLNTGYFSVQKEAAWIVSNIMVKGSLDQIKVLIDLGAIPAICYLLSCQDAQLVVAILDGLYKLLCKTVGNVEISNLIEECGGLDEIEKLQYKDNVEIYQLANKIIDTFFSDQGPQANTEFSLNFNFTVKPEHNFNF